MKADSNRTYIDTTNIKVLAVDADGGHRELPFDYTVMQKYNKMGFWIYATNNEGVFFFTNNKADDGKDWCKITKVE